MPGIASAARKRLRWSDCPGLKCILDIEQSLVRRRNISVRGERFYFSCIFYSFHIRILVHLYVLRPEFENGFYKDILNTAMPYGITMDGLADAAVIPERGA